MHIIFLITFCYSCCISWKNIQATNETDLVTLKLNEYDIDYGDEDDNVQNKQMNKHNVNRPRSMDMIERVGVTYMWNRWEKWSKCANSCVQIKRRKCIQRSQFEKNATATFEMFYPTQDIRGCFGMLKKFRHCKEEKCRNNRMRSFRDQQCAFVANKDFKWMGIQHMPDECQLYCHAVNTSNRILNMNITVLDGTPCERPAIYYTHGYRQQAVCVEGICRAVHASGVIRPTTTSDSQMRCGSLLCKTVSEIFSQNTLNMNDYNFIAKIPAGAMNMSIRQAAYSENLLALKSEDGNFIINGNPRPYRSGIYEYNGDSFDYNHDANHIISEGPLVRPVLLMVYAQKVNPGIFYEYILPVSSSAVSEEDEMQSQWNELGQPLDEIDDNYHVKERRRRKFSWKLLGFAQCSRSCGPGVQTPVFRCIRDSPTRYYTPKRCAYLEKPVFSADIYHCNRGLCPAFWRSSKSANECNCTLGTEKNGTRALTVECVQEKITGKVEVVAAEGCDVNQKPNNTETCACQQQLTHNIYTRSTTEKTNSIINNYLKSSSHPLRRHLRKDRNNKTGVWLMSNWQEHCDVDACNSGGFDYRSIYCDRTTPFTELCDLRYTPQQKRACAKAEHCQGMRQGVWLTSAWSNCTGDCFNLHRKRIVMCMLEGVAVDEKLCGGAENKPASAKSCQHKEIDYCRPKWHYSEWSECSRSCGEGQQRRYAKCLDYDWHQNTLLESNKCSFKDREPVLAACNIQDCEEEINIILENPQRNRNPMAIATTTPIAVTCSDEFSNCKRINRQRLCKLKYYKSFCCQTCSTL